MGYTTWSSLKQPCPYCHVTGAEVYTDLGKRDNARFHPKGCGWYETVVASQTKEIAALEDTEWSWLKVMLKQNFSKDVQGLAL
eukprot:4462207-Amphidinium_carterae.1